MANLWRIRHTWRIGCVEVAHYILLMTKSRQLLLINFSDFVFFARPF